MYILFSLPHTPPFCEIQVLGVRAPTPTLLACRYPCRCMSWPHALRRRQQRTTTEAKPWLLVVTCCSWFSGRKQRYRRHARPTQMHTRTHTHLHVYAPTPRMYSYVLGGPMMEPCAKYCYPWVRRQTGVSETNLGDFWIRGSGRIRDFGDGPTIAAMTTRTELSPKALRVLTFF